MSFLKKLGQIIVTGLEIASGILPLVSQAVPNAAGTVQTISKDLAEAMQIIVSVEAMGAALGLPGPEKLRAAAPQIEQILMSSSVMIGKPIANPQLALQGATKVADGLADWLNAIHPDAATGTPVTVPAPPAA